jgi:hypothetical protein
MTFKEAGVHYVMQTEDGTHVLWAGCNFERWVANKGHAGTTLTYKNTELEFCSSYTKSERDSLLRSMYQIQNFGEQHPAFHSTLMNCYRKHIVNNI